jgi:hypothetical protein
MKVPGFSHKRYSISRGCFKYHGKEYPRVYFTRFTNDREKSLSKRHSPNTDGAVLTAVHIDHRDITEGDVSYVRSVFATRLRMWRTNPDEIS